MSCAPRWLLLLIVIIVAGSSGCGYAPPLNSPTAPSPTALGSPGAAATARASAARTTETAAAVGSPASPTSPLTVAEVYRRAGLALLRPGLLYHATIRAETDTAGLRGTGTTTQWVDAGRAVAREEVVTRNEQANGPPDTGTRTAILTTAGRYSLLPPPLPVMVAPAPACHGATLAAVVALGCPGFGAQATVTIEQGAYAGRPAVVLVTAEVLRGEYAGTLTTRLSLDPATCLPLAAEGAGEVAGGGPRGGFQSVGLRATYAHEFLPADAVPADFFDPAALGHVAPGDDIARPVPAFPDFRAYWLGERFAGAGDLPPLAPGRVERPLEPGGGPGYQFILSYGRADDPFGSLLVTLQEWSRATWGTVEEQSGPNYRGSPCWVREELTLPEGRAILFSGYAAGPPPKETGAAPIAPGCPAAPPDTFLAHAYLGQTVLLIDAPSVQLPDGSRVASPYNSRAGMALVLRGLQPRQPCLSPPCR